MIDARSWGLNNTFFRTVINKLPDNYRTALHWTQYLPLETVLELPWDANGKKRSPLLECDWSETSLSPKLLTATATFRDYSTWPWAHAEVPLPLLAHTLELPRSMWEGTFEYEVSIFEIPEHCCKAFLVQDVSSKYGLRPMTGKDVITLLGHTITKHLSS